MIWIYADVITERLQYTLDFVFTSHGIPVHCTNDKGSFEATEFPRLNYSEWEFDEITQLVPHSLLFDESVNYKLSVDKCYWEGIELLSLDGKADPFAAVFYVLSRYEEYTIQQRDRHDRFEATSSILYKFGWLEQQVVERWIEKIIAIYCPAYFTRSEKKRIVEVIPSFDIDNTFAYKWKDGWRKWMSILKDYSKKNKTRLELRKKVLAGKIPDPFDTYDQITAVAERYPGTRIFWLMAELSAYDRNISGRDPRHQRLIRNLGQVAEIGLHPGYASNLSDKRLSEEQEQLEKILDRPVMESRQHFLKLRLPLTYQRLIALGFTTDYTMGYADKPGFRAGTAHPFHFFDLGKNTATNFLVVPFVYMDGTFREYLDISIEDSKQIIVRLADEVKLYGGTFCFIWHNETIGDTPKWKGWNDVLAFTLAQFENGPAESIS